MRYCKILMKNGQVRFYEIVDNKRKVIAKNEIKNPESVPWCQEVVMENKKTKKISIRRKSSPREKEEVSGDEYSEDEQTEYDIEYDIGDNFYEQKQYDHRPIYIDDDTKTIERYNPDHTPFIIEGGQNKSLPGLLKNHQIKYLDISRNNTLSSKNTIQILKDHPEIEVFKCNDLCDYKIIPYLYNVKYLDLSSATNINKEDYDKLFKNNQNMLGFINHMSGQINLSINSLIKYQKKLVKLGLYFIQKKEFRKIIENLPNIKYIAIDSLLIEDDDILFMSKNNRNLQVVFLDMDVGITLQSIKHIAKYNHNIKVFGINQFLDREHIEYLIKKNPNLEILYKGRSNDFDINKATHRYNPILNKLFPNIIFYGQIVYDYELDGFTEEDSD